MNITIIGAGYVGLVSGVCLASVGHKVAIVDNDQNKIANLAQGVIPIYEPGLVELLKKNISKISFTTDLVAALGDTEVVFIAVGTPAKKSGEANLAYVFAAAKQIAINSVGYKLIVTKSTVPIGTNHKIAELVKKNNPKLNFSVASNPEFLREGFAIKDFLTPDRVVIGTEDKQASKLLLEVYQDFSKRDVPILNSDIVTAEIIKYAANSFLATKIAFINEMADLCEKTGGNIKQLAAGIGLDQRIGKKFLEAGPGFGGSCFPKDMLALLYTAKKYQVEPSLVKCAIKSNQQRFAKLAKRVAQIVKETGVEKKLSVLGLTFKAGTDDVRESPAIEIIKHLLKLGFKISAFDPKGIANAKKILGKKIAYHDSVASAANNTQCILILTEWNEFKEIGNLVKNKVVIDFRNLFDVEQMKGVIKYYSIGSNSGIIS